MESISRPNHSKHHLIYTLLFFLLCLVTMPDLSFGQSSQNPAKPPRLILQIPVDQFRGVLLPRYKTQKWLRRIRLNIKRRCKTSDINLLHARRESNPLPWISSPVLFSFEPGHVVLGSRFEKLASPGCSTRGASNQRIIHLHDLPVLCLCH